jgi:hypothetical protein
VAASQYVLPARSGSRPRTSAGAPHSQLDQLAENRGALTDALISRLAALPHVELGGSLRAPPGTVGLHIEPGQCRDVPRAFLLGREFAHVHAQDDGSLHAILPEPLRTAAIARGWAEPHPLAGEPTVSEDTVMIYAPRDYLEVEIIAALVHQSWLNACSQTTPPAPDRSLQPRPGIDMHAALMELKRGRA